MHDGRKGFVNAGTHTQRCAGKSAKNSILTLTEFAFAVAGAADAPTAVRLFISMPLAEHRAIKRGDNLRQQFRIDQTKAFGPISHGQSKVSGAVAPDSFTKDFQLLFILFQHRISPLELEQSALLRFLEAHE
jgi:hypothetical protein